MLASAFPSSSATAVSSSSSSKNSCSLGSRALALPSPLAWSWSDPTSTTTKYRICCFSAKKVYTVHRRHELPPICCTGFCLCSLDMCTSRAWSDRVRQLPQRQHVSRSQADAAPWLRHSSDSGSKGASQGSSDSLRKQGDSDSGNKGAPTQGYKYEPAGFDRKAAASLNSYLRMEYDSLLNSMLLICLEHRVI
ncbi:hypothetical protein VE00_10894 [Pseudogymnoascus sp. WSF 3629]|nr:hypothetical protein VE00_10894 [Pseudogymnoascus sp. WSF 3629]